MISRRALLKLGSLAALSGVGLSSYAFAIEPRFRLIVTRYRLQPAGFPAADRPLRVAVVADIHACDPWMPMSRIEQIVDETNRLKADVIVLLGDFLAGLKGFRTAVVPESEWGKALGKLWAPHGVFSILGNHDWWTDVDGARNALLANGIRVLENESEFVRPDTGPGFWLAGLGDQIAYPLGRGRFRGVDDLPGTLARIGDDRPVVLLAHEPDIFPKVPQRVALTLSGHTHGGQVNLPIAGRLIVPSAYGDRYAYGHVVEDDRHLIVSGGLGLSVLPIRLGVPPEILLVELG